MSNTDTAADFYTMIEMDSRPPLDLAVPAADELTLDMTSPKQTVCVDCSGVGPVNDAGRCRPCDLDRQPAPAQTTVAALVADLTAVAQQSAANAATTVAPDVNRIVGFNTKEGYIGAIRNGVPAATHASYLLTLRTRFGMTTADIAALNLPGPMVETTLPVGAGIKHVPAGPSIFDRPREERGFKVGDAAEFHTVNAGDLAAGKVIAVARSAGHGCVIAWAGRHSLRRGDLAAALLEIGMTELLPKATSARAQAGRALEALNAQGFIVRVERKGAAATGQPAPAWTARYVIGALGYAGGTVVTNPDGTPAFGTVIATATLVDDQLSVVGRPDIVERVTADFRTRVDEEMYQSSDITAWLGSVLIKHCDAVQFGAMGWYIGPRHVDWANRLCSAVKAAGFGAGWVVPGLPVTDSDHLRDGLLGGLTEEVDDLMHRLETERAAARSTREAKDIGPKRAASFLADLRKIGERVAGYAVVLGDERVRAAKERVRLAVVELETVLGDDHSGISARFAQVWDEIERDRNMADS
jgi:hypothetical protein